MLPGGPYPLLPNGRPLTQGSLETFGRAVEQQAMILTASDTFLVLAAVVVALMVVLLLLPERTVPPRLLPRHE